MIARPDSNEYLAYYGNYINSVGDHVLQELADIHDEVISLMKSLSTEKLNYAYAEGKWSIKTLFTHMIDVERVMTYRAMCFARGEKDALPGFDHDQYGIESSKYDPDIDLLIEQYQSQRKLTIAFFKSLSASELTLIGNANGGPLSPRAVAFIVAGHDKHHLKVIKERYL